MIKIAPSRMRLVDAQGMATPEFFRILQAIQERTGGLSGVMDAADIASSPTGDVAATNVQAAIAELAAEKATVANLDAHITDAADAHDASAISNAPAGGISATTVQAAIDELDADKEAAGTAAAAVAAHVALADPHAQYLTAGEGNALYPSGSGTSTGTNTGDQFTATTASRLIGRGAASGAGAAQEITVGSGLTMTGTTLSATGGGTGDVVGPASAVNNRVVLFDGTTGKLIKDSGLTLSGSNTGDQTSIVGITGTLAEFNAALTGADFATGGGTVTGASSGTNTGDQTVRELLTAARTYYVRTDGSDSNTGLVNSSGGAFLTKQKAIDTISNTLDMGAYQVTVQVVDGAYAGNALLKQYVGQLPPIIQGNSVTPANVHVNIVAANTSAFTTLRTGSDTTSFSVTGHWIVKDMKLTSTRAALECYGAGNIITFSNIVFGACVFHILSSAGGEINIGGAYSISGSPSTAHILSQNNGIVIQVAAYAATLLANITTTTFAWAPRGGLLQLPSVWSIALGGFTVTGKRYLAELGGVIVTNGGGASYFPGTIAGTTDATGTYDGATTLANKFIVQGTTDTGLSAAQFLGALATGIVKNTTTTGVLSIAAATDFPTLNQNTSGTAANVTGIVLGANGGTGIANTGKTITLGGNLTTSGAFASTFTMTNTTTVTFPTTGTLATLAGVENLSNKTFTTSPVLSSAGPALIWDETDQAANLRRSQISSFNGGLVWVEQDDTPATTRTIMATTRGGAIVWSAAHTFNADNTFALKNRFGSAVAPVCTVDITGTFARGLPVTKTANFTVSNSENWLINNKAASSCTVTIPAAASWPGREFTIKNAQAFTVISAASDVVPITGGAAGTAILPATVGAWATLVSDGTSWITMARGT